MDKAAAWMSLVVYGAQAIALGAYKFYSILT